MCDHPQSKFVPSPEYLTREKRFYDAVSLKKPDRVPVASLAAFFVTRYAGLTNAEAMTDYERMANAWLASTAVDHPLMPEYGYGAARIVKTVLLASLPIMYPF